MKTIWFSKDDEELIRNSFKASRMIRERLKDICKKKAEGSYQLSEGEYDNPNWALKQADSVGYRRALLEIINLITE